MTWAVILSKQYWTWVGGGGRLVITGYELGERHHQTNINRLAYYFGILFRGDVIVRSEPYQVPAKHHDTSLQYDWIVPRGQPMFANVNAIRMMNACSLHLEPGAVPLVMALARKGLAGERKLLPMGTWDFRAEGDEGEDQTVIFLRNLWWWLTNA